MQSRSHGSHPGRPWCLLDFQSTTELQDVADVRVTEARTLASFDGRGEFTGGTARLPSSSLRTLGRWPPMPLRLGLNKLFLGRRMFSGAGERFRKGFSRASMSHPVGPSADVRHGQPCARGIERRGHFQLRSSSVWIMDYGLWLMAYGFGL
jgi:hypothetical protein